MVQHACIEDPWSPCRITAERHWRLPLFNHGFLVSGFPRVIGLILLKYAQSRPTCGQNGYITPAFSAARGEYQKWPTGEQNGYITPAFLGGPNAQLGENIRSEQNGYMNPAFSGVPYVAILPTCGPLLIFSPC